MTQQKNSPAHSENQIAVIIDFDNIDIGYREKYGSTAEVNWKKVSEIAVPYGRVVVRKAYADWSENSSAQRELLRLGFQLINVPSRKRGKNAADIKIVIDAIEEFIIKDSSINHVLLVSGDGDFTDLVHYLRSHGKFVIGMGILGSSAEYLINACDQYEYYDLLEKPDEIHRTLDVQSAVKDSRHDVSEARQILRKVMNPFAGEWVSGGMVKNQMQRLKPDFHERNYGHDRFKDFLKAQEDIVTIRFNEKGGHLEVTLRQNDVAPEAAGNLEAQVDKYLLILARNHISMTPSEHRPLILKTSYDLIKGLSNHSYLQIREEIYSYFEENHPEIRQGYVKDMVHQIYITGCFKFDSGDKSSPPGVGLWQRRALLRTEIKSADELLRRIDSHLIRVIEAEVPAAEMDMQAVARVLYGTVARPEILEYLKDFRLKTETGL